MQDDKTESGLTGAQKIDKEAILDAKAEFEALNDWLEKIKAKIESISIEIPPWHLEWITLFTAGYYLGTRSNPHLKWLTSLLSGGICAYSGTRLLLDILDRRHAKKEVEQMRLHARYQSEAEDEMRKAALVQSEDQPAAKEHSFVEPKKASAPTKKQLKNVKIFEPNH